MKQRKRDKHVKRTRPTPTTRPDPAPHFYAASSPGLVTIDAWPIQCPALAAICDVIAATPTGNSRPQMSHNYSIRNNKVADAHWGAWGARFARERRVVEHIFSLMDMRCDATSIEVGPGAGLGIGLGHWSCLALGGSRCTVQLVQAQSAPFLAPSWGK